MTMWYKFASHNEQAVYGYGTEAEAAEYVARLNQGREINLYTSEALAADDAEATRLAGVADITAEGVDLAEELADDDEVHEVAVYAQHCVMSGRVCLDPEAKYGEDWRDNADLVVYKGTSRELRKLFAGTTGWMAQAGRAVLAYVD